MKAIKFYRKGILNQPDATKLHSIAEHHKMLFSNLMASKDFYSLLHDILLEKAIHSYFHFITV